MASNEIEQLIRLLARLPGLGPRSARRAALHLIRHRETLLDPLSQALNDTAQSVRECRVCGNLDTADPCGICTDPRRNRSIVCVVEGVADVWALERAGSFDGVYHVLGGVLSALDGRGPEDLRIAQLADRVAAGGIEEVILAISATVDGQTTAHYIADRIAQTPVSGEQAPKVTRLAHGVPVGGELDYLDDGTLLTAMKARLPA